MDWTEKYRPKTLNDIVGNDTAVRTMRTWARQWEEGIPDKRALVLKGSPGVGKTSSALALANEMGWTPVEMNASDQRNESAISDIALRGSMSNTFGEDGTYLKASEGGRKLIILDEADNLFGIQDKGAMPVINRIITESSQPVILIVNDFYALSRKSPSVKTMTEQVQFYRIQATTMAKTLRKIADNEGVEVEQSDLLAIATNASGDMRAAVRNLESLALGADRITPEMAKSLSTRDNHSDIFGLMKTVFSDQDPVRARQIANDLDEDVSSVLLWLDENLPLQLNSAGDQVRGFARLSQADIFISRVYRRQYYGFWSYAKDIMVFGLSTVRQGRCTGAKMEFPKYLKLMSSSKNPRALRKSLCLKIAVQLHTSTHRVSVDVLPYIAVLLKQDKAIRRPLIEWFDLTDDEYALITGTKADSKTVVKIFQEIEEDRLARISSALGPYSSEADAPEPEPEPPKPEPKEARAKAPDRKASKNQKSLFDF